MQQLKQGQIYKAVRTGALRRIKMFDEKTVVYDFKMPEDFDYMVNCTTSINEFFEFAGELQV
ncbi:MAG: hypothetical protein ACRYGG_05110 [Janthinobacterium lividum]